MVKMAVTLVYGKTIKNPILQKQKSYEVETWHAVSGPHIYNSYINDDPGLTFTYFIARSNLVCSVFEWGNCYTTPYNEK